MTLEETTRIYGTIPFSKRHSAVETAAARERVLPALSQLRRSRAGVGASEGAALDRLALMLEFESRDLAISALAGGQRATAVKALVDFLAANADKGVFLVREGDRGRYERMYGVTGGS